MDDPLAGLRIREAARAVVLDDADRILLVRFEFPGGVTRWALPGGGVEPGETSVETVRRELLEEVGLAAPVGPAIWRRTHVVAFVNGEFDGQRETIHLVRTPAFDPVPSLTWEQLNAEYVFELRWWTLDDLRAAASDVVFVPGALVAHLAAVLVDGPPPEPIDVGV